MLPITQFTGHLLVFITLVQSAPTHLNQLNARRLLGSSFGVPGFNQTFDYVILGGGTAGLTIAARLAETATVAVIEAGSFYEIDNGNLSQIPAYDAFFVGKDKDDYNPLIDWGFQTTAQAVRQEVFALKSSLTIYQGCAKRADPFGTRKMSWWKLCPQLHDLSKRNGRFI